MKDQHQVGKRVDSPIRPMGALKRFFIRLLLIAVIVGAALGIARLLVFAAGIVFGQ